MDKRSSVDNEVKNNEVKNKKGDRFDPLGLFQKKNKGSDLSSGQRGWEPMVNALKGINDEQQQEWVKIHVEKGKIEFFDKEGKHETLDKHENPARFLQFEYKLREHLVKEALSNSNELSGKEITEVEKKEGVYKIKCKEMTVGGSETVKEYEIKKKDDRYHLSSSDLLQSVDVQDSVQSWEKTIRDLK